MRPPSLLPALAASALFAGSLAPATAAEWLAGTATKVGKIGGPPALGSLTALGPVAD